MAKSLLLRSNLFKDFYSGRSFFMYSFWLSKDLALQGCRPQSPSNPCHPLQALSFAASYRLLSLILFYLHTNRLNRPSDNLLPTHATHSSTHPLTYSPMPNQPYHYLTDFRGIPVTRIVLPDG